MVLTQMPAAETVAEMAVLLVELSVADEEPIGGRVVRSLLDESTKGSGDYLRSP